MPDETQGMLATQTVAQSVLYRPCAFPTLHKETRLRSIAKESRHMCARDPMAPRRSRQAERDRPARGIYAIPGRGQLVKDRQTGIAPREERCRLGRGTQEPHQRQPHLMHIGSPEG